MQATDSEGAPSAGGARDELLLRASGASENDRGGRRPTDLLREILTMSDAFQARVQGELTVNTTDLKAMEHLIAAGALSPTELARRLGVSTAAVTAVIDRLTALGHASRSQHPTDRRGLIVQPNPASVQRALGVIMPMVADLDGVLDGFSPEEQLTITAYLDHIATAYQRHLPQE